MGKFLTIVGRGPSWRECLCITPEIWGVVESMVDEGLRELPFTKLFAFDDPSCERLAEAIKLAKQKGIPVVSEFDYADEKFPTRDIVRALGASYFRTSVSRMLAYAIYLGYDEIFLDGIDQGPEWQYQAGKPHMTFWLGYAAAKGITVTLGKSSLIWQYVSGLDGVPFPFKEKEADWIANHMGESCVPV